ncbi:hypothetical protein MLS66_28725, partial [Escherichia coli]|nr:hypothetical protein [Escherichia coli]
HYSLSNHPELPENCHLPSQLEHIACHHGADCGCTTLIRLTRHLLAILQLFAARYGLAHPGKVY